MLIDPTITVHAPHPDGGVLCEGPLRSATFTDPMGRVTCRPCVNAGVHQPTELGNMMGGYDCECGGAWMGTRGHCTNQAREAGK